MINLAITQSGPDTNTVFPNQIEIDYVRVYQENVTNIIDVNKINKYVVYPSPAIDALAIHGENLKQVKIFNIHGELVLLNNISNNKEIDISKLNKGMYLIELEDHFGFKINKKLIKN